MPTFGTRFEDGWSRAKEALALAAVPLVVSLFAVEKIGQILSFRGARVGIQFLLPVGIVDPLEFVSVPAGGGGFGVGSVLLAVVGVVVRGVLAAGYFGSIRDLLAGEEYSFGRNAGRYAKPFLLLTAIPVLVGLLFGGGLLVSRSMGFGLLGMVVFLVAGYLFYGTPYLVVLRETDLVSAAAASYDLATEGGPYARYAAGFLLFSAVVSLFATAFVVNLGLIGLLVGLVVLSPVGLALNVATMRFIADVDPAAPDFAGWEARDGPSGGSRPGPDAVETGSAFPEQEDEDVSYDPDRDDRA